MKCRAKREMKDAKSITMKNGRPATQAICPTYGTKMFRIGKSKYNPVLQLCARPDIVTRNVQPFYCTPGNKTSNCYLTYTI